MISSVQVYIYNPTYSSALYWPGDDFPVVAVLDGYVTEEGLYTGL